MRLTVTPLGASGQSVGGVARAVVDYLDGEPTERGVPLLGSRMNAVGSYYADSIEGPGRWRGAGAAFRSLDGIVTREAFQRVLEGRHPTTGERLVTARGSSQRSHLAVGTSALLDANGEAMYTTADAAKLLGITQRDIDDLVRSGLNGSHDLDDLGWIGSRTDASGETVVPDREITRHLEVAALPVDVIAVRRDGPGHEELSAAQCARLLRVSVQYVRRICSEESGADSKRAVLRCRRDGSGRHWIRRDELAKYAERRKPAIARVGFDLTLTVEKSIGVLTMLSTGQRQQRLVDAFQRANDVAIDHLDYHASGARRCGEKVGSEGLTVASYLHGTSRSLDPHPHYHNIVANAVVDDEGDVRTLDARGLYRHAPAAAALATAAFRWETRELGLGWWRRDDGIWEVAGVSNDAVREFSTRHGDIDEVRKALAERLGRDVTPEERNQIALTTRSTKQPVDPNSLREQWLTRADRVGLDIDSCFDRADRAIAHDVLPDDLQRQLFDDLVQPHHGLCAESNTFTESDVIRAIADWSLVTADGERVKVLVAPGEVERLAARFCAIDQVVEVDMSATADGRIGARREPDQQTFATVELLEVEKGIQSAVIGGLGASVGSVDPAVVEDTIAAADVLSVEQADLVRNWLTSGDRVQCAVGRAGTGKTITMRVAAEAWAAAGFRVLGASVKGEAARLLAGDAGIESETVAMFLGRSDAGQRVLDARTVLIVDEASTIGDRDLLRLCTLAEATGAALRLIGDPAQHGSVAAGGSFNELVRTLDGRTPELTTVYRLTDTGERERAELVRDGHVERAITELEASGQLVLTESEHDTHAAMLTRWQDQRIAGRPHPMVHGRNRERRVLNSLAQQLRIEAGEVDETRHVALSDGRRLCVGDEVVARHGDRSIHPPGRRDRWMRNGSTGVVVSVRRTEGSPEQDAIEIAVTGATITCTRSTFDRPGGGLDLAYAVTSYAVQGATNDVSTSAITASTNRSELYVDITRGRHHNQLYATRPVEGPNSDLDRHLPRITAEIDDVLRTRLARSDSGTVLGRDRNALAVARQRSLRTLPGLVAAQRRGDESEVLARAIEVAAAAHRRIARHEPPRWIERMLPARPQAPHQARRWDDECGDLAVDFAMRDVGLHHGSPPRSGLPSGRPIRRSGESRTVT